MKLRHAARALAIGVCAVAVSIVGLSPASADMSVGEETEANAAITEMATFIDGFYDENGILPTMATVEAEFPYEDGDRLAWAYVQMEDVGYCLDFYAFQGRTLQTQTPADFRFHESTTGETFTPTTAFMNSTDQRPGACGDWSRAGFPQPSDINYPTGYASTRRTVEATSTKAASVTITEKVRRFSKTVTVSVNHNGHRHTGRSLAVIVRSATRTVTRSATATAPGTAGVEVWCDAATQEAADACAEDLAAEFATAQARANAQAAADEQAFFDAERKATQLAHEQAFAAAKASPVTAAQKTAAVDAAKKAARAAAVRAKRNHR